jgi:hypothetical protein
MSSQNIRANLGPLRHACGDHYQVAAHPGLEEARHGEPSLGSRAPLWNRVLVAACNPCRMISEYPFHVLNLTIWQYCVMQPLI